MKAGVPVTRETYLLASYPGNSAPKKWTLEHELELPEHLRDMSLFDRGTYIGPSLSDDEESA